MIKIAPFSTRALYGVPRRACSRLPPVQGTAGLPGLLGLLILCNDCCSAPDPWPSPDPQEWVSDRALDGVEIGRTRVSKYCVARTSRFLRSQIELIPNPRPSGYPERPLHALSRWVSSALFPNMPLASDATWPCPPCPALPCPVLPCLASLSWTKQKYFQYLMLRHGDDSRGLQRCIRPTMGTATGASGREQHDTTCQALEAYLCCPLRRILSTGGT